MTRKKRISYRAVELRDKTVYDIVKEHGGIHNVPREIKETISEAFGIKVEQIYGIVAGYELRHVIDGKIKI